MKKTKGLSLFTTLSLFFLLFLTGFSTADAASLPKQSDGNYAFNQSKVLSKNSISFIQDVNKEYKKTTEKPQIVVAAVNTIDDSTIETYAEQLFQKWKIGNREYDNGILILFAKKERKIWIEVGYGLEGQVTDSKAGRIIDDNIDLLRKDKFDEALKNIFTSAAVLVNKEYDYENATIFSGHSVDEDKLNEDTDEGIPLSIIIIGIFSIISIALSFFYSDRNGPPGGKGSSSGRSFWDSGGFGGGSSGGSSGGGFFGGGGSSGGGGAGRSF